MKFLNLLFIILFVSIFNLNAQKGVPDFTATDIYGTRHELHADYLDKGKYVLIDFFSVSCGSCMTATPKIDEVFKNFGCNYGDVVFLGVSSRSYETDEDVWSFTENYRMTFPAISGASGGNSIATDFNISWTPYHILISPDSKIIMDNTWDGTGGTSAELTDSLSSYGLTTQDCEGKDFIFFSLVSENDSVVGDIDYENQTVSVTLPTGTNLSSLTASFINAINSDIEIDGTPQVSGETVNDFSSPLTYRITSEINEFQEWTVNVSLASSVEFLNNKFSIYPNPSKGKFIIENNFYRNTKSNNVSAKISDITGKIVKSFYIDEQYINVNMSEYSKGIYFVNLKNANDEITKKIILY